MSRFRDTRLVSAIKKHISTAHYQQQGGMQTSMSCTHHNGIIYISGNFLMIHYVDVTSSYNLKQAYVSSYNII